MCTCIVASSEAPEKGQKLPVRDDAAQAQSKKIVQVGARGILCLFIVTVTVPSDMSS